MPPKHKQQLDKGAWQWAETTNFNDVGEEHVKTAYRLNLTTCERGACKRNCKGNPFCLNSLGEKKWFVTVDESKLLNFDPDVERRQKGDFVGLKNLGATCYVNTFLQLWFHNASVRRAVCQWRDEHMPVQYYEGWKPSSICGHLQVIFALLQSSNRCYVDPSPLIDCLGVDAGLQQDAQEFSKLFIHKLESFFSDDAPGHENVIKKQFCGQYSYVTKCQGCGSHSETAATFYELDLNIRGHSTLAASIKDFLQEENLEGDNLYMCSVCDRKQKATRAIKLGKLPPVLNLQLLRFVFDKNKGHKKKLSSFIQFPETLDMGPYLSHNEDGDAVYELSAVLIHRGPSAYSGHYIAHIRELETDSWYKFNDEEIEKMKNRKLELGKEEDGIAPEGSSEKAPKTAKGTHSSRNAYMLVYNKRAPRTNDITTMTAKEKEEELLPAAVQGYVAWDNQEFENWISQMLQSQDREISEKKQAQEMMKNLYLSLPVRSLDEPWEWVSTDWLTKWLADPTKTGQVQNKIVRCPHDKLQVDDVVKLKVIRSKAADVLFTEYPVDKRYSGEPLLCRQCIRQKCRNIHFKKRMSDDDKLFLNTKNIIQLSPDETYYWVSTKHLRSWKKFAMAEDSALVPSEESPVKSDVSQALSSSLCVVQGGVSSSAPLYTMTSVSSDKVNELSELSSKNLNCNSPHAPSYSSDSNFQSSSSVSTRPLCSSFPSSPPSLSHYRNTCPHCCVLENARRSRSFIEQHSRKRQRIDAMDKICELPGSKCHSDLPWMDAMDKVCGLEQSPAQYSSRVGDASWNAVVDAGGSAGGDTGGEASSVASGEDFQGEVNMDTCESPDSGISVVKKSTEDSLTGSVTSDNCEEDAAQRKGLVLIRSMRNPSLGLSGGEGGENGGADDEDEDDDDRNIKFNSDLFCRHGNLRVEEGGRRAVPTAVWQRLCFYFPHLKPVTISTDMCQLCLSQQLYEQDVKQILKQTGQEQKEILQELYHGRGRPRLHDSWDGRSAFVVSSSFLEGWKKFVKHSVKNESVQEIVNAPLLCEHNLLLYKPEDMNMAESTTRFCLVWESEWMALTQFFAFDVQIQVMQVVEEGRMTLHTEPGVCSTCLKERIRQEEEGKFIFGHQLVYIRKVPEGGFDLSFSESSGKGYNYDPEFSAPPKAGLEPPPEKQARLDSIAQRKSSRHRKTRGERELMVSSSMTLKELKIQLFSLYGVPPFDQNLALDGRSLSADDATLQDLRVYPQCVIFLKADQPCSEASSTVDDYLNVPTGPEEGFKGTNLM